VRNLPANNRYQTDIALFKKVLAQKKQIATKFILFTNPKYNASSKAGT
jgi:hypothetical protein